MKKFSEKLQICLDLRGKNAYQLSLGTGISRSTISLYLRDKRFPKPAQCYRIADYLNVSPAYLLGLTDQIYVPTIKPTNSLTGGDDEKKALLDEIMSVCSFESTNNLKTILSVVKAMAKK